MRGRAFAKINLSLRVGPVGDDGLHPIWSLVQSIDWADEMELESADADGFEVHGADLPADGTNLAWRAVEAIRGDRPESVRLVLDKSIALAAGVGGGSADAALGLVLAGEMFGASPRQIMAAAPDLGADVPFCLVGGFAVVTGIGEVVEQRRSASDYAVALVVPPFELATPTVYRRWDELGRPRGPEIDGKHLPRSLRAEAPLVNDLQPAALAVEPRLGDWISDVRAAWGQPVAMSGSGPTLFSLFGTNDEAADAVAVISGARVTRATTPVARGWETDPGGTLPPPPWGVV